MDSPLIFTSLTPNITSIVFEDDAAATPIEPNTIAPATNPKVNLNRCMSMKITPIYRYLDKEYMNYATRTLIRQLFDVK
ncbi:hypothetical protein JCM16163A_44550 [Paenibacillus sp. YK5]